MYKIISGGLKEHRGGVSLVLSIKTTHWCIVEFGYIQTRAQVLFPEASCFKLEANFVSR